MLIKHASRTNRKPCWCHGSQSIYWAHDTDITKDARGNAIDQCDCGATGKMVLVNANDVTRNIPVGGQVPDSERHQKDGAIPKPSGDEIPKPEAHQCNHWSCVSEATQQNNGQWFCDEHVNTPAPTPQAASPKPQPEAPATGGDAVSQALQTLMSAMGPKIDTETIRDMVRDEFKATVFPTRTVILDNSGNDVTPENLPETSHEQFADVLTILSAATTCPVPMSILMVGPAGSGKSTIARNAATALSLPYGEISLNPMLPVTNLLGYMNATGDYVGTVFREIWEFGGVFHADEFDNGHPSTMATLNAALACGKGGSIAFPDGMVAKSDDFVFIASANTFGRGPDRVYVGRQQLDAATLDRFVTVEIGYDEALEHQMCLSTGLDNDKVAETLRYVRGVRRNITSKKMTVLMTPRSAVFACTLVRAKLPREKVISMALRAGISDADWSKATDGVVPMAI